MIYHLGNFDDLIQSGFWVIPKIIFAYLHKLLREIIIISDLYGYWNLRNAKKKDKNTNILITR